ncbi:MULTISPECIES: hypothetical protein [unclassified Streptococcus]|uniref:hypothetical protein n=1 Tax=unclassified Streptococcus TaxID=2608887 RepID=UPI001430FEBD|nr:MULTISPECIES: hypothetical protein [unclassified Streptococcus]MBF0806308.1 hypothetical protein [Streptococcus sp. 19428wA2_WM07]
MKNVPETPVAKVEKALSNTGSKDGAAMAGATVGFLATLSTVKGRRKKGWCSF